MDVRAAKELMHVRAWLGYAKTIVARGKRAYLADPLLQEAGADRHGRFRLKKGIFQL
jgi:hypothetical protein